jgi:hypothetical protein
MVWTWAISAKVTVAVAYLMANSSHGYSQPFGSRDEVASKNIFLVSAAALKCDNFTPVFARIREYAQQSGVDLESLKDPEGKYKGQRQYAIQIVQSHIQIAGV